MENRGNDSFILESLRFVLRRLNPEMDKTKEQYFRRKDVNKDDISPVKSSLLPNPASYDNESDV